MAQPLRIEDPDRISFITTRTANERLLFINNKELEDKILAKIAQYQEDLGVLLFALPIMGNHIHLLAQFPRANRAKFMQQVNSVVAKIAHKYVPNLESGKFWARRYSEEEVPRNEDVEERFFYLALQPVISGLCEKISEYPGYNSFYDAISGRTRKFKVLDHTAYNNAKRFNPKVKRADYTREVTLKFQRLPGYEHLSQKEYMALMLAKLEARRVEVVEQRRKNGQGFLGRDRLLRTKPMDRPSNPKKSTRQSVRPLVLTSCSITRKKCINRYFATLSSYREASARYLAGDERARFPPGTYKPPRTLIPVLQT